MAKLDPQTLRETLCALYLLCGPTTKCRVPREAIMRRLHPTLRGLTAKALKELQHQGLIYKAGGKGKTYGLTREGVRRALEECREE